MCRFGSSLVVSVLLHALVLALPSGRLAAVAFGGVKPFPRLDGLPAPLQVRLSPWTYRPAAVETMPQRKTAIHVATASTSSDTAKADGGRPRETPTRPDDNRVAAGVSAATYFDPADLTLRASPLSDIVPNPESLRSLAGSGATVVTLFINEAGGVDRISVETSNLPAEIQRLVEREFGSLRFKPAEIEGVAVASRMRVEIRVAPLLPPP